MIPSVYPTYSPYYSTYFTPSAPQAPSVRRAEVGPSISQRLVNSAQGYFQTMPGQMQSQLSISIPMPAKHVADSEMLALLLVSGSAAAKAQGVQWSQEGIRLQVQSATDKLTLHVSGPAGEEGKMASAALQLLTRPMMDEPTYRALKGDFLKRLHSAVANPEYAVAAAVNKVMYGEGHPYAMGATDLINALEGQTFTQVQQRLRTCLQFPGKAMVSMVSSQPEWVQQQVVNQSVQQWGWFASATRTGAMETTPPPRLVRGIRGPVCVPEENLTHARIIHSWHAPQLNDPDYPAFFLLKSILGGFQTGFSKVLRTDKGLVYNTDQHYARNSQTSDYTLSFQVDYAKVKEGLLAVRQVVQEVMARPVSAAILETAKKGALLTLREQKESSEGIASENDIRLALDLPPVHPDAFMADLQRVTVHDLQRVANRVFNPAMGSQVIGVSAPLAVLKQHFSAPRSLG